MKMNLFFGILAILLYRPAIRMALLKLVHHNILDLNHIPNQIYDHLDLIHLVTTFSMLILISVEKEKKNTIFIKLKENRSRKNFTYGPKLGYFMKIGITSQQLDFSIR